LTSRTVLSVRSVLLERSVSICNTESSCFWVSFSRSLDLASFNFSWRSSSAVTSAS